MDKNYHFLSHSRKHFETSETRLNVSHQISSTARNKQHNTIEESTVIAFEINHPKGEVKSRTAGFSEFVNRNFVTINLV